VSTTTEDVGCEVSPVVDCATIEGGAGCGGDRGCVGTTGVTWLGRVEIAGVGTLTPPCSCPDAELFDLELIPGINVTV